MQANLYSSNDFKFQNGNFGNGSMANITGLDLIGA